MRSFGLFVLGAGIATALYIGGAILVQALHLSQAWTFTFGWLSGVAFGSVYALAVDDSR